MDLIHDMINRHEMKFSTIVINYVREYLHAIEDSEAVSEFFDNSDVDISVFVNELLIISQENFDKIGDESISHEELHRAVREVIISIEFADLFQNEHVMITSIKPCGKFNYILDEYAIDYFKKKWNVDFSSINR